MLDRVTHRKDLREELITITRMLMGQPPAVMGDLPPPGRRRGPRDRTRPGAGHRPSRDTPRSDILLDRMMSLHPKLIDLTLDRMWRILGALDHPEQRLPPVIHIAGTNGKGSTLAMIRAGWRARAARRMPTPRRTSCASTNASALPEI
jgi:hypothetical protein